MILYIDNTNLVQIKNLLDSETREYVTTATVVATLLDSAGVVVPGAESISLVHDVFGTYTGKLPNTLNLTAGEAYTATVTATVGDVVGEWNARVIAADRLIS